MVAVSPNFHRFQTLLMLVATYRKALTTQGGIEQSKCRWEEQNNEEDHSSLGRLRPVPSSRSCS